MKSEPAALVDRLGLGGEFHNDNGHDFLVKMRFRLRAANMGGKVGQVNGGPGGRFATPRQPARRADSGLCVSAPRGQNDRRRRGEDRDAVAPEGSSGDMGVVGGGRGLALQPARGTAERRALMDAMRPQGSSGSSARRWNSWSAGSGSRGMWPSPPSWRSGRAAGRSTSRRRRAGSGHHARRRLDRRAGASAKDRVGMGGCRGVLRRDRRLVGRADLLCPVPRGDPRGLLLGRRRPAGARRPLPPGR